MQVCSACGGDHLAECANKALKGWQTRTGILFVVEEGYSRC